MQNKTIKSYNPTTGELLGEFPISGREEVEHAIKTAKRSFTSWGRLSFKERARFMVRLKNVILKRKDEIIDILVKEVGKPKMEALFEVGCVEKLIYYARNSEKFLEEEKVNLGLSHFGVKGKVIFEPVGVVGIIVPFNFPFFTCFNSFAPALMAGNTVIIKPSAYTSCCYVKFKEIIKEAGFPEGVVNILIGDSTTGQYLVESDVDRISFTGGVNAGKRIMQTAAQKLHPIVLELGGTDPAIVCKDIDLEFVTTNIVWGRFLNAGQVCASIKRVYVVEDIAEKFIEKISEKTKKLRVGNPENTETDMGPLISQTQLDIIIKQIEDAKNKGARIVAGGRQLKELGSLFYAPTVLTNVNHDMFIMREEAFGPALPIMKVKDEDEAIRLANDSDFGLAATVWTKDLTKGENIARQIQSGMVWVNNFGVMPHSLPMGGAKKSGIGRLYSRYGLLNFVNIKSMTVNYSGKAMESYVYPYSQQKFDYLNEIIPNFYSDKITDKIKAGIRFLRGYKMGKA